MCARRKRGLAAGKERDGGIGGGRAKYITQLVNEESVQDRSAVLEMEKIDDNDNIST